MSKGEATRERIVERAFLLASRDGLSGLSIGGLADELGMSKSGLFAHFGSKEDLQLAVLDCAAQQFTDEVIRPALKARRGLPRLKAMFENWLQWGSSPARPGGCIFPQASAELDDRPGRPRDALARSQTQLLQTIGRAAQLCVDEGHFKPDVDPEQFAFEAHSLVFGFNHAFRLLRDPRALKRARVAFERLLTDAQP